MYKYINDIGNNGFVNILFDSGFFYYSRNYIDKLFNVLLFVIDNNIIEYTDYEYYYNEIINNGFVGEKGDNVEYYYNTYQSNSKMYLDNNGKLFTYNDGDSNYYPTITGLNKFNFNCVDENDVIIAKYVVYIPSNLVDNVEIIEVKFTKDLYDSYNGYCSYLLINQYPINDNDLYNSISDIESFFGFSLLARSSSDGFVKIYTITDVENKIININELTNEYILFTNYYNLEILKVNRFGFDPNLINGVLFDKISIDKENSSLLNIPFNGLILYTDIPGPAPVPPAPSYHPAANPAANQEDPGEYPSNKYLKPDNDEGVNNNYCIFNNNTMCFKNNNVWYLIFNNLYRFNYNTQNEQYLVYSSLPEGLNYDLVLIDKNINSGDSKFQGYLYEKTGKIFHQPLTSSILFTLLRDIRDIKKNKVLNIYDIYLKYNNDLPTTFTLVFNDNNNVKFNEIQNTSQKGFLYLTYYGEYVTNPRLAIINDTDIKKFNITEIEFPDNIFSGYIINNNINDIEDNYNNKDVIFNLYDNTLYIKVIIDDGNNDLGLIPTSTNNTQIYFNDINNGNKYSIKTDREGVVTVDVNKTSYDLFNSYYGLTDSLNQDYYTILQNVKNQVLIYNKEVKLGDYLLLETKDNNITTSIKIYKYINDTGNKNGFSDIDINDGFFYISRNYGDDRNRMLFIINNTIDNTPIDGGFINIINLGFYGLKGDNPEGGPFYLMNNGKLFMYYDSDLKLFPVISGLSKFTYYYTDNINTPTFIERYIIYIYEDSLFNEIPIKLEFPKNLYNTYHGYTVYNLIYSSFINETNLFNTFNNTIKSLTFRDCIVGDSLLAKCSNDNLVKIYTVINDNKNNNSININELTEEYILFTNYYNLEVLKVNKMD